MSKKFMAAGKTACVTTKSFKDLSSMTGIRVASDKEATIAIIAKSRVWPADAEAAKAARKAIAKNRESLMQSFNTSIDTVINNVSRAVRSAVNSGRSQGPNAIYKALDADFYRDIDGNSNLFIIPEGGYFVVKNEYINWVCKVYNLKHFCVCTFTV